MLIFFFIARFFIFSIRRSLGGWGGCSPVLASAGELLAALLAALSAYVSAA